MKLYAIILAACLVCSCTKKPDGSATVQQPKPANALLTSRVKTDSAFFDIGRDRVQISLSTCMIATDQGSRKASLIEVTRNGGLDDLAIGINEVFSRNDSTAMARKVKLAPEDDSVVLVSTYIDGSTFGAQHTYVIWKNNRSEWRITQDPFSRGELGDVNHDGVLELVNYDGEFAGKPPAFNFRKGMWIPH